MGRQAFEGASRRPMFMVEPERLVLITDPAHYLYDVRALEEPDEALVESILSIGVQEPVIVKWQSGQGLVVDGRRRVIAAKEAARRQSAGGVQGVLVPCVTRAGDENLMEEISIATNEIRREVNAVARARKAASLLDRGWPEERVARCYGIGVPHLRRMVATLEKAAAPVLAAVEAGTLPMSSAQQLARLPAEQQEAELQEMRETGRTSPAETKKRVDKSQPAAPTRHKPTAAALRDAYERAKGCEDDARIVQILGWVVGEETTEDLADEFEWLASSGGTPALPGAGSH